VICCQAPLSRHSAKWYESALPISPIGMRQNQISL
jgi:hypothetical protein